MADDDAVDVQAPEITPEDFDGEQETPKAESTPVKEEARAEPEKKTPEAEPKEEAKPEKEAEPEAEPEGEAEKPAEEPEKPLAKADERKAQLNTEIRDLVAQRNTLKEQVAKANAEVYQPATENELVDEGMSATDAKVEALRQEIEVSKYNEKVADAQLTIGHESNRVLTDFAWSDPESKEYKKELAEEAAGLLQANLIYDPNTNQVIGSNVSPYQLYKTLDRARGISTVEGQIQGQNDTEQMLANADTGSSAAPAKKPADPLATLWEEEL